ncbi:MAG TPA: hypothetical protein VIG49_12290 [Acetobacteraceae bacterium]
MNLLCKTKSQSIFGLTLSRKMLWQEVAVPFDPFVHRPRAPDAIPRLTDDIEPPLIVGTAALAHRAFAGQGLEQLLACIDRPASDEAALTLDAALAHELTFNPEPARSLQRAALAACQVYRVAGAFAPRSARPLRVLAMLAPGDVMTNIPLDFITGHLDIRLDLVFVRPDAPLPAALPDHDIAIFAVGEGETATLQRLDPLFLRWPRPALNRPAAVARLSRDTVAQGLMSCPTICSPLVQRASRAALSDPAIMPCPASSLPVLVRPVGSHAGRDLVKIDEPSDLADYLMHTEGDDFFITRFVDYSGADGMFRKYRIAFIGGAPFLCHMAVSDHWMVHYLNAGMTGSAARRAEEARAMQSFDSDFAPRHAAAFAALNEWMALDYYQIDCAEAPDGRLLVFEVDVAGIIHAMDPPELFPYKPAQMQRVFAAFDGLLRARASRFPGANAAS